MKIERKAYSIVGATLTIVLAIFGLLGYFLGMEVLGSIKKDYIPMAPSTSISFVIMGMVLLFLNSKQKVKAELVLLSVFTASVSLFGILNVIGYLIGKDINFEKALLPTIGSLNGIPVGLMSPATGATFFLVGLVQLMLILQIKQTKGRSLIEHFNGWLSILILLISFVFCLAYLYGTPLLYQSNTTIPMALTTALGFLFLSFSILTFQKNFLLIRLLSDTSTRSYLLRFILPLSIISVILGGLPAHSSIFTLKINPAFFTAVLTVAIAALAGFASTLLSRHLGSEIDLQRVVINQAKQALQKSEEQYRTLFETMTQGVVYQSAKGEIISANPAAAKILGLSIEQMKGRTSIDPRWKAVDKDKIELPGDKHPAMAALNTGKIVENFVLGIYNPIVNDYVWIIVNSVPQFREGEENPYQVYSTFLDITERKKAEENLSNNRKFLSDLIENSGAAIYAKNKAGQYELVNRKWEELTGIKRENVLGNTDVVLFPDEVGKQFRSNDVLVMESGKTLEKEEFLLNSNGKRYFISIIFPIIDENGHISGICGISTEITDRKKAEEELNVLKVNLEQKVVEKTKELNERISELERFHEATIDREIRMKELRDEIKQLKKEQ